MMRGRGLAGAAALVVAALSLGACASSETAGELVNQPGPGVISSEAQENGLNRSTELIALMQDVNLDPCPTPVPRPDPAIPGLPDQIFDCLGDTSTVSLAHVRGMPMVVNVWASWCPPCIEELPLLQKTALELDGEVDFMGINIEDDPIKALQLMQDFGVTYPSVIDPSGDTRAPLTIVGPPVTYFVTPEGVIAGRWNGAIPNEEKFYALLQQYLGIKK